MTDSSEEQAILSELDESGAVVSTWNLKGKTTFRLGRGPGNDFTLPFSWVSRQHSIIQQEGGGIFQIIDLGSANGTYINSKRIFSPTILNSGDIITMGKTTLKFSQFLDQPRAVEVEQEATMDMTIAYLQKHIVTILVCDLRDFTSLSELMGNQVVSKLIQFWTKKVGGIVQDNDGNVDKFIGDAVMATWVGGTIEEGVRHALAAALQINNYTRRMGESIPEVPRQLAVGAAINTGEAMMGNMGVDSHRDSTVIGDVVNVTFRLESLTKQNVMDVIIGEETAKHIQDVNSFFTRKSFILRGKKGEIEAYGCTYAQLRSCLENF
ncbi:MAG: adenylate/guanylate cyclase domain-containing protein [Proteobacteria bacterium]|nr:adenylate/guanylate cyclase domain-containing protein [Pseudomonadota bacterium]MBU1686644.1 adenylate/guanylate cyclase domain-containing protein [Pseudomonadota bacterium]